MARPRVSAGGGVAALSYSLHIARQAGGLVKFYRRMRLRNSCKTCALGMGGQWGGMVNEAGHFPEVCKKSLQAQAGDMQGPVTEDLLERLPFSRMSRMTSAQLERLGRISFPMIAEKDDIGYRRISWDEAWDKTAAAFENTSPDRVFFYSSGRSSNEAAFLMQVVARAIGTANINNCSCYCHNASGVALSRVYGSGTASVVLEDLEKADLAVIAGANPASNHPRLITQLVKMRRRGGKVIVVNPLRELGLERFRIPSDWRSMLFGSTVSDLYIQPHVGSDVALFKALLKAIVEQKGVDDEFVGSYTDGWEAVEADLANTTWDELTARCGVSREQIDAAAAMLVKAQRGIFCWAMGLTHHVHGVDNVLSLSNLALARGWLGRPGCGLLPIRGHSNVQGVGSVGVNPTLKKTFADRLHEAYGIEATDITGWDTYRSMEAARDGHVDVAFMMGGNLYASNPDLQWAKESLEKIPFSVYVSTKFNEGHVHGRGQTTIVLPPLARDEETQPTTQESMFNFVRLSDGGAEPPSSEMRSEVDIIATLAERILPENRFDWNELRSHKNLREQIARVVPGYESISDIDGQEGEFQITGRTFHSPEFTTPSGRAQFIVAGLPAFSPGKGEYRLMTLRSEGQFNTVVYEEEDLYRGNTRRDVVMISLEDADRLGLAEGDPVTVSTECGSMDVRAAIVDIRAANLAMYYPEANVLVPRKLDKSSGTPAFKSVVAKLGARKRT
jgi:molybdopterin-dependent oxidoreductase alpha subunit